MPAVRNKKKKSKPRGRGVGVLPLALTCLCPCHSKGSVTPTLVCWGEPFDALGVG